MKWCFLVNDADIIMDFLGRFCQEVINQGDECLVVFNSSLVEYTKRRYFPEQVKTISRTDWLKENFKPQLRTAEGISWRDFFASYERKKEFLDLDYRHSVDLVEQHIQFFEYLFSSQKPDVVVNEPPANVFTEIAFHFCQTHKKQYIGFIDSRMHNRIDVFDQEYTTPLYEKTFISLRDAVISSKEKAFAVNFISDFVSHKKLPTNIYYQMDVMRSSALTRYLHREGKMMPFWLTYAKRRKATKDFDYETETKFQYRLRHPWVALKRNVQTRTAKKYFRFMDPQDEFFLFPLQFYPEASMLVWATYFCNQVEVIKNIAFALPFPYKLYVKEHPMAVGIRPPHFYDEIGSIPNVVLIDPTEKTDHLIKNSKGVVALTSTLALESALIGKPTYLLGNVFYEYHPGCTKVSSIDELRQKIQKDLLKPKKPTDEKDNVRFILSYFKNTVPGSMYLEEGKPDSNDYAAIYKDIKNKFLSKMYA